MNGKETDYELYVLKLKNLEEEREDVYQSEKELEQLEEEYQMMSRGIKRLLKELTGVWNSRDFYNELDTYEQIEFESGREIQEQISNRKRTLQKRRKRLDCDIEEYESMIRKIQFEIEDM